MTEALLTGEPQTPTDGKTAAQDPAFGTSSAPAEGKQTPATDAPKEAPKGLLTEDAKAAEKKEETKAPAVPEKYDLKVEGDVKLTPTLQKGFEEAARAAGLNNESANKLLNSLVKTHMESQTTQRDAIVKDWSDQLAAHKTLGGEKLEATLADARKTLKEFLSDESRSDFEGLLRDSGLQFHPGLIELLANVQKKVGGDRIVTGAPAKGRSEADLAKTFYPEMA